MSCVLVFMSACSFIDDPDPVAGGTVTESRIYGSITSLEGERASNARVALLSLDQSGPQQSALLRTFVQREQIIAETELMDGQYEFKDIPAGNYVVRAIQNNKFGGLGQSLKIEAETQIKADIVLNLSLITFEILTSDPIITQNIWTENLMTQLEVLSDNRFSLIVVSGETQILKVKISQRVYDYELIPTGESWDVVPESDAPIAVETIIPIPPVLIAHYPFDGDAQDVGPFAMHGTVVGPVPYADRKDQVAGALYFDGLDDVIEILDAESMKVELPISFSTWIRPEGLGLPLFTNDAQDDGLYEGFWVNLGVDQIEVAYGSSGTGSAGRQSIYVPNPLIDLEWNHLAVVIRGASDVDFYVNGTKLDSDITASGSATGLAYGDSPARFGAHYLNSSPIYFYKGAMDDFKLYQGELSEADIEELIQ
jgi:hypothetical protein